VKHITKAFAAGDLAQKHCNYGLAWAWACAYARLLTRMHLTVMLGMPAFVFIHLWMNCPLYGNLADA